MIAAASRAPARTAAPPSGGWAFRGLIAFILVVYASPAQLFGAGDLGVAKVAAAASLTALAGSALLYQRRLRVGGLLGALVLLLFAWLGLSSAWSLDPGRTRAVFGEALKYLSIFLLVVNVVDSPGRLRKVASFVAWATAVPALGALVSYARGEHLVDGNRAAWIGIFANPNDLAYHLAVGAALALAAREAAPRRATRVAYLALVLLLGGTLVLTGSRGGLLALSAVVALSLLRGRRARALVGAALTIVCLLQLDPGGVFRARTERSTAFGEDVSARGRLDAWRTGMRIFAARPLTGVGAGAFVEAWPRYAPGDAGPPLTEHNTFVQLLAELGLPALLLFGGALAVALRPPRRAPADAGVRPALIAFGVCSLTTGLALSWPLYLLLGMAAAERPQLGAGRR
jgi:O-antigen ligase